MTATCFVLRERLARHPLLGLKLLALPLVSSGLAYKAAAGLATAGLGYLVTLQLQLDWGWTPVLAAIGMLPQVVVLVAGSMFVNPFVQRVGLDRAAWSSAAAVVSGLAVYGLLGRFGYLWVAVAITGTILATLFTGDLATSHWSPQQTGEFHQAVTTAGLTLTVVAAALVGWGIARTRHFGEPSSPSFP